MSVTIVDFYLSYPMDEYIDLLGNTEIWSAFMANYRYQQVEIADGDPENVASTTIPAYRCLLEFHLACRKYSAHLNA